MNERAATGHAAGATVNLVSFSLVPHRFAVDAVVVREIVRAVAVAALPKAPSIVEGVINYRGTIVPVLDIRQRFGLPATPLHPDQHFIVAEAGSRLVALRVDRVLELAAVSPEQIVDAGSPAPGAEHVAGIARRPDGLIVIHDLEGFLSLDEAAALDGVLATAAAGRGARS